MANHLVALLRAINVGGTGKLAMADLKRICETAGLHAVQTYIASGNVIFRTDLAEPQVKASLEHHLHAHAGCPIGVLIRTHTELAHILRHNPFPTAPASRVVVIFLDHPLLPDTLHGITGQAAHEHVQPGRREIYVHYGEGQANTRLHIPAAASGTARNINTVAKLVTLSAV